MGLDNIPKTYACVAKGTAVKVCRQDKDGNDLFNEDGTPDLVIDCEITMAEGGCPWKNAAPNGGDGAVYGMFGTPCWYRGKYGNHLLYKHAGGDPMGDNLDFYGDKEDGTEKSPESCVALADYIGELLTDGVEGEDYDSLAYAEWYLRWAAKECDGLICWF